MSRGRQGRASAARASRRHRPRRAARDGARRAAARFRCRPAKPLSGPRTPGAASGRRSWRGRSRRGRPRASPFEEGALDRFLAGRQDQFEAGAVEDIDAHAPGCAMDGLDRGQADRQGQAEEVEVWVVVAAMAVPEDAEGEAAPGLGMDRAVEEGAARQRSSSPAVPDLVPILEDDRQRVMAGGVLRRVPDRGGGFRRNE